MITLPAALIPEKNSLGQANPWLVLLEIAFQGETIRLVRNEEDITWNGYTWTRFPFEIDSMGESKRGEVPSVSLRVSNINRAVQAIIEQYDGGIDADVVLRVIHAGHLAETTPALRLDYTVTHARADAREVVFMLGASNLFRLQFPRSRCLKNFCRWRFKASECGYVGAETACDKTLTRCREIGNSSRFGGFPGVGFGGLTL